MQITKTLCDRDYSRGKEVTEGVTTITFALGKRQFEVDLCPACHEALNKAVEPFVNDGRRAGRPATAPSSPPRATATDPGPHKCEEKGCSRSFETVQGLSMHRFRSHAIKNGRAKAKEKAHA